MLDNSSYFWIFQASLSLFLRNPQWNFKKSIVKFRHITSYFQSNFFHIINESLYKMKLLCYKLSHDLTLNSVQFIQRMFLRTCDFTLRRRRRCVQPLLVCNMFTSYSKVISKIKLWFRVLTIYKLKLSFQIPKHLLQII